MKTKRLRKNTGLGKRIWVYFMDGDFINRAEGYFLGWTAGGLAKVAFETSGKEAIVLPHVVEVW